MGEVFGKDDEKNETKMDAEGESDPPVLFPLRQVNMFHHATSAQIPAHLAFSTQAKSKDPPLVTGFPEQVR